MRAPLLQIDLNAIANNFNALNDLSHGKAAPVVKANAYGLGLEPVVRTLQKAGARRFFVATYDEAIELKSILEDAEIYELSGQSVFENQVEHLIPVINSGEQLRAIGDREFALNFDTGMTRLGIDVEDLASLQTLRPKLVMSHLACADEPAHAHNSAQRATFLKIASAFPDIPKSLSATGGILLGEDFQFDLTRPGIGIYGGAPYRAAEPVLQISLPVLQIRDIQPGTAVGYGASYVAKSERRIATVLGGYADGISRALSNQAYMFYEGHKCDMIGRVSMDSVMVDISDLEDTPSELQLIAPSQTINDLADMSQTIAYEFLTGLGNRFNRLTQT